MQSLWRFLTNRALLCVGGILLLYSLFGFVLLPAALVRTVPMLARHSLHCLARLGQVRLNPFRLTCEVSDFSLLGPDGQPLVSFAKGFVDFAPSALVHRTVCLRELRLDGASLHLVIEADGRLNFATLAPSSPPLSPPSAADPSLRLLLQHLVVADGTISLTDRRQREVSTLTLGGLDLQMNALSSARGEMGTYYLATTTAEGESIEAQGEIGLVPLRSRGRFLAGSWQLATPWAFVRDALALSTPAGTLDVSANYHLEASSHPLQLGIEEGKVGLSGLSVSLAQAEKPLLLLTRLSLAGVRCDLASQSLSVKESVAEGGHVRMDIDEGGRNSLTAIIAPAHQPPGEQVDKAGGKPLAEPQLPWRLDLPSLTLKDIALELTDRHVVQPMVAEVDGLSSFAGLSVTLEGPNTKVLLRQMEVELKGLRCAEREAARPGIEIGQLLASGGELDSSKRSLSLSRLGIDKGWVDLQRDQQGKINLAQLLTPRRTVPAAGEKEAVPWTIKASELGIRDVALAYEDLSLVTPLAAGLSGLSFRTNIAVRIGATIEAKLTSISSEVSGLRLGAKGEKNSIFDAQHFFVEGGELDLGARKVSLAAMGLSGGHFDVSRGRDGRWEFEQLFAPRQPPSALPDQGGKPEGGLAWNYAVKGFELKDFQADFRDRQANAKQPVYQLSKIHLRARDIDGQGPIGVELDLADAQGGALGLQGTVDPGRPSVEAKVKLDKWRLTPLQPYLEPYLNVALSSGALSSKGRLRYGLAKAGAKVVYDGEVRFDQVRLQEAGARETFLGWKALAVRGISLAVQPNRLRVKEVQLQGLTGKLIIAPDRTVNLAKMLKQRTVQAPGPPPFPFSIGKVVVEDGQMVFADLSLQPQFMARIHGLKGVVSQLSSEERALADIQLDGGVDQYGYVTISGVLNPQDVSQAAEVNLAFDNLALASITPYSGKFAGRTIRGGKLSSKMHYTINDQQMDGDNTIWIDNLELGEHVDSPEAINLPLDLAVALLQDSKGRIDIGLPVSGDLKDPQFGLGPLLWKAFSSLISKAVTAPFRMLGALFGGGGEQSIDAVAFAPGKAELLPPEKEKLMNLAEILTKRPQLRLKVQGHYQVPSDGLIFRQERLHRAVAARGGESIPPGEVAPPLDLDDTTTQRTLEAIFSERLGKEALAQLDREVKEGRVAPRQEAGLRVVRGRGGSQGRFAKIVRGARLYRLVPGAKSPEQWALMATEMYARLLEGEAFSEQELQQLASQRAVVVGQELQQAGGIDNGRIAFLPPAGGEEGETPQVRFSFEAL